ncbi:hypothetical protein FIBSPDRAFT_972853, partial [Athelia psychrophila]
WDVPTVYEAHLTYEWAVDFCQLCGDIWAIKAHGPCRIVSVGLSATIEPGHQMKEVFARSVSNRELIIFTSATASGTTST